MSTSTRVAIAALLTMPAVLAQMTVYSSGPLPVGQTKQLTAYVPLPVQTVTWSVNGVLGGGATYGTVSTNGLYQAPTTVPVNNAVTVTATSTYDPSKSAYVTITVTQPPVQLWSISPTSVAAGQFTILLNGADFAGNSTVMFGTTPLITTLFSKTSLQGAGTALTSQIGTQVPITVVNSGLGGTTSSAVNLSITKAVQVTVTVSPSSASVPATTKQQFTATVTGNKNQSVNWSVNGIANGNSTVGTISSGGLYTAPKSVPNPATVTIQATSVAVPSASGTATVTVQPPPPPPVTVTVSPAVATVAPAGIQPFSATVTGSQNQNVNWSVNGVAGGNSSVGTVSTAGLYTAPGTVPSPPNVTVTATSVASPSSSGNATVTVAGPPDPGPGLGTPNLHAARFLEQAAFGPNPAALAHVNQIGIGAWLTEQFNMAETPIIDPGSIGALQSQMLSRFSQAPDQLRQRVAYALSRLIVISANKNINSDEIAPYLEILNHDAFGNYRTLLGDISVSSQMGKYLDLAKSMKPGGGSGANENYAREVMQLFSIGLYVLNPDGSQQLDSHENPIPTYNQTTIQQVALALTGWDYINHAWEDFSGPLQPFDANHDMTQKTMLGCSLPAGQTTVQDMNGFLDCLFNHPNVGPFIATRLIRSLVTSNPSPGYIQRVATVFNNNGQGVRGDLQAVVSAILTDTEARNDSAPVNSGHLKDPIFHIAAFARALNGTITPGNGLAWIFGQMSEAPLIAPSVFSFYSPLYLIPRSTLFGPEFQIYTPTESILRGNFFWEVISNPASDFTTDISPFITAAAGTLPQLIDAVDQALLYGRMPHAMRQSLANAIVAQSDNTSKAQTALFLTALSGFYAIQY